MRPSLPLSSGHVTPDLDRKLTLSLPASVVRQLRQRMAQDETTLRALVLEALSAAGYAVPAGEIRDRRRPVDSPLGPPAARLGTSFTKAPAA